MTSNGSSNSRVYTIGGERVVHKVMDPADFEPLRMLMERNPGGLVVDMSGPTPQFRRPPQGSDYARSAGNHEPRPTNGHFRAASSNDNPRQGLFNALSDAFLERILQEFRNSNQPSNNGQAATALDAPKSEPNTGSTQTASAKEEVNLNHDS